MPMSARIQSPPPLPASFVPGSCSSLRPLRLLPSSLCNNSFFSHSLPCISFSPLACPALRGVTHHSFTQLLAGPLTLLESALMSKHRVLPCFSRNYLPTTPFGINTCGNLVYNYVWNQHLQKNPGWGGGLMLTSSAKSVRNGQINVASEMRRRGPVAQASACAPKT